MPFDQTGNEPDSLKSYLVKMIEGHHESTGDPMRDSSWGAPSHVWNYNPSQDEDNENTTTPTTSWEDAIKHYSPENLDMSTPSHFKKLQKYMGPKGKFEI